MQSLLHRLIPSRAARDFDEEIGVKCNRCCGMKGVYSANSTCLKIKLLKLKAHCGGCQIQHRNTEQLDYHLYLRSDRSRCRD